MIDSDAARRQRLMGIAVMCVAVACLTGIDAIAKYLNAHMDTLQVVWARYTFAFLLGFAILNPLTRPGMLKTHRPLLQFTRAMLMVVGTSLNVVALRFLQLEATTVVQDFQPCRLLILLHHQAHPVRRSVLDCVVHRFLCNAIECRCNRLRQARCARRCYHLHVDSGPVRRVARELLQSRHQTEIVQHARVHRVREQPDLLRDLLRRVPRGEQSLPEHRIVAVARRCRNLQQERGEVLRGAVVQLAGEYGALTVTHFDHLGGQGAHPLAVRGEPVEQQVEHRADAEHLVVGDRGMVHARAKIALPHPRRDLFEIPDRSKRDQYGHDV